MSSEEDSQSLSFRFLDLGEMTSIELSQSDEEFIGNVRKYSLRRTNDLERSHGASSRSVGWHEISLAFPNTVGKYFELDLEASWSRTKVGLICGSRRGPNEGLNRVSEYLCATFESCSIETLEYFILTDRKVCEIAVDAEFCIHVSSSSLKPFHQDSEWSVSHRGKPFGTVMKDKNLFSTELQFQLHSGLELRIPLGFGLSSKEVFILFWDLFTLRFLRNQNLRENRSYVLDPISAKLLQEIDQKVFFATALYFICSPFQHLLDGD